MRAVLVLFYALHASSAQACENGQSVVACLNGQIDQCIVEAGEPAVIPSKCWEQALEFGAPRLEQAFARIIAAVPDFAKTELMEAQEAWRQSMALNCRIEVMSNPRTYDLMFTSCRATAIAERTDWINTLNGADWTPY